MTSKNWSKLFKDYKGQWVALDDDEVTVVAHGKVVSKVLEMAAARGKENPILFKVPSNPIAYIG